MHTVLSYFEDTYLFKAQSTIISSSQDEIGYFVVLDRTIFYPQGGGQPSDSGKIEDKNGIVINIIRVKSVENIIKHYTDKNCQTLVGQSVTCHIDQEKRLLHAQLHTAGHLIANVVEKNYPHWHAIKGHHFPDQCYVEFMSDNTEQSDLASNISTELINKDINKYLEMDNLIAVDQVLGDKLKEICTSINMSHIADDQMVRIVRIGDFAFSPCGGTHVKSTKELKGLEITKIKIKNKTLRVNYKI